MKCISILLYLITLAALLFVGAAIGGHSESYAPAAILLAASIATAQQRKRARDRR